MFPLAGKRTAERGRRTGPFHVPRVAGWPDRDGVGRQETWSGAACSTLHGHLARASLKRGQCASHLARGRKGCVPCAGAPRWASRPGSVLRLVRSGLSALAHSEEEPVCARVQYCPSVRILAPYIYALVRQHLTARTAFETCSRTTTSRLLASLNGHHPRSSPLRDHLISIGSPGF